MGTLPVSVFRNRCLSYSTVVLLIFICFNELTNNGKARAQSSEINPTPVSSIFSDLDSSMFSQTDFADSVDAFLTETPSVPLMLESEISSMALQTESSKLMPSSAVTEMASSSSPPMTDYCDPSPCVNGNCTSMADDYSCTCEPGWTNHNCSEDIDDCNTDPCKHGGNCTDYLNYFNCTCPPGYTDQDCSTDIDDCADITCQNEGKCVDQVNDYMCNCSAGWTGDKCETDIDDCNPDPCKHGGNCTDYLNYFNCTCPPGYTDQDCSTDIDDCVGSDCMNEGSCVDQVNHYTCNCSMGWTGDHCEEDIDECKDAKLYTCHDHADCQNKDGGYNCVCKPGYSGDGRDDCVDIDDCEVNPCENDGICSNTRDGQFRCSCTPGWTGFNCSTDVDECQLTPAVCDADALCDNFLNGTYMCTCEEGFRGNGASCTEMMLFPDGLNATELKAEGSMESIYGPYRVDGGLPYFGTTYTQIYVSMNGYLVLGERYPGLYPPSTTDLTNHIIMAPFWAAIDTSQGSGRLLISQYSYLDKEILGKLSALINETDFTPKAALVATWLKVSPYPASIYAGKEEVSFQAIIATDRKQTFVVFNYDIDMLTWDPKSADRRILIGRTIDAGIFEVTAETLTNGTVTTDVSPYKIDITEGTAGKKGRWIYNGGATVVNPKDDCLMWFEGIDMEKVSEFVSKARPCPCGGKQAQLDPNYIYTPSSSIAVPKFGQQQCHYDSKESYLMKGYPGGGYPVQDDSDLPGINQTLGWNLCCMGEIEMCNLFYKVFPSDDCSSYRQPKQALSWGDPHIITLDGNQYTYNGWGEYILLKTGSFESQCRTSRARHTAGTDSNATLFTAFALKDAESDIVEIRYDSGTLKLAINGTDVSSDLENDGDKIERKNIVVLRVNNITVQVAFSSQINFQVSQGTDGLGIVTYIPDTMLETVGAKGLLGHADDDPDNDFEFRNGTVLSVDSTELQLFEFGNSWRINATESLFNYALDGDGSLTHDDFDHPEFVPDFYSDKLHVLDELFPDTEERGNATETCQDNKACLVDLAATGNKKLAEQTKMEQTSAEENAMELDNNPPVFQSMPDPVVLYPGEEVTINLNANDPDNGDTVTFDLSLSDFKNAVQMESDNLTYVKLTPTILIRNVTVLQLKILARDGRGAATEYWPELHICGCRSRSECNLEINTIDHDVNNERFYRSSCQCDLGYGGDFCTDIDDVCESRSPCYAGVNCTMSDTPGQYACDPCPAGLEGDGTKCYDVNECLTANDCEQKCENFVGSYRCLCDSGYDLHENKRNCTDINECLDKGACKYGEYCTNRDGGYLCRCLPGYYNRTGSCEKDVNLREYIGFIRFSAANGRPTLWDERLKDSSSKEFINQKAIVVSSLSPVFNFTDDYQSMRVTGFRPGSVIADYIVAYNKLVPVSDINGEISRAFSGCRRNCQIGDLILPTSDDMNVTVKDFCVSNEDNDCDKTSTRCMNINGSFECPCLPGFKATPFSSSRCDDIDECLEDTTPCGVAHCTNTIGSYTCYCDGNLILENGRCVDKCEAKPCKNAGSCMVVGDTFACKCSEDWTGTTCEENRAEHWKEILIVVASVVGGVCLIAIIIIIVLCVRRRNTSKAYSGVGSSAGDSDSAVYQGWSGKIPRPKRSPNELEMVENGAGKNTNDDPNKPLTSFDRRTLEGKDNPSFSQNAGGSDAPKEGRGRNEYF